MGWGMGRETHTDIHAQRDGDGPEVGFQIKYRIPW